MEDDPRAGAVVVDLPDHQVRDTFRPSRSAIAIVAVLLVLAATGYGFDRRSRQQEFTALLTCARAGQAALGQADARGTATGAYVLPSLAGSTSERLREQLYGVVADAVGSGLPGLRQTAARCRAGEPAAWHPRLRQARQAYLTHLDARIGAIETAVRTRGGPDPLRSRLDGLEQRALGSLLAAAPDLDGAAQVRAVMHARR